MIDLTGNIDKSRSTIETLECFVKLDENKVLELLNNYIVYIEPYYYECPETQLIKILNSKKYGIRKLTFIKSLN